MIGIKLHNMITRLNIQDLYLVLGVLVLSFVGLHSALDGAEFVLDGRVSIGMADPRDEGKACLEELDNPSKCVNVLICRRFRCHG